MGCFWLKYIMIELKKYRGVIFSDNVEWCKLWRKTYLCFQNWHEEFGKFSPEHLKVSKLELWWDSFIQSRKCFSLKFTGELCVMTMNNDAKFEEELTCQFKILTQALNSLKKLHFDALLLTKVYDIWAKKVQRSYIWWHWILMQNLNKNWRVLSKMTWRIWKISQAVK